MERLENVTADERDKFYAEHKCVPTSCQGADRLTRVKWIKQENAKQAFVRVLELGCHDGFSTRWLLNSPFLERLHGVELSKDAVEHARRLAAEKAFPELAAYECMSVFDLPTDQPGVHTEVVCFELLEHFHADDGRRLVGIVHANLEAGGRAFLTTPHVDGVWGKSNPDPTHIQFYDDKTVATLVREVTGCKPEVYVADDILHVTWTKP